MKTKNVIFIVIALTVVIFLTIGLSKNYIVDKYYPTNGCDSVSSAIETTNKECECSGLKLSKNTIGYTKSICLGKQTNFSCWDRNSADRSKHIVNCE